MAERTTRKIDRRLLWLGVVLLLAAVFYIARILTREKLQVRVAGAQRESLVSSLSTNGKVEPQTNFEAHSPISTTVKNVYVHEGDKVAAGTLLVSLDDAEARSRLATAYTLLKGAQLSYDALQKGGTQEERFTLSSDLNKAKLDLDQAQRDHTALQRLQATGAASASEVNASQQRVDTDTSILHALQQRPVSRYSSGDLEHARAAVADAQTGYDAVREALDQSNVRAPFAGTVYSLPVSKTEFVGQGKLLLQMADLNHIQIRAYFDEPEIGKLAIGQPIKVVWDAKPGRAWHGHISRVPSTIVNYGTRNVGEVLVAVDDSDGTLLPNTNVTVTVTYQHKENVLSIPREALHTENGKTYVFRVENDILRRVPIEVGTINLTQVEVVSGLSEHDAVALGTTNGQTLVEDAPARIAN